MIWDPTFSEFSYGFRPGRSAHGAINHAKQYVEKGLKRVVSIDLSKFFDRVNHDRLMSRLATKVHDKRLLKLIRKFLTSGVMIGGFIPFLLSYTSFGGSIAVVSALNNSGNYYQFSPPMVV
ncbi:reverse transcriptase domain-containing protein [Desulforhopalus vacuolatus]|uniref:reverse transcriptase domain-containing protein n=1 Tax=Desulforhopalus vacuolatus TaxID=40414 RepID=UPI001F057C86